jgi:hypothetical protein
VSDDTNCMDLESGVMAGVGMGKYLTNSIFLTKSLIVSPPGESNEMILDLTSCQDHDDVKI